MPAPGGRTGTPRTSTRRCAGPRSPGAGSSTGPATTLLPVWALTDCGTLPPGCEPASGRSPAVRLDEGVHPVPYGGRVEVEVLEDGVSVRPGARGQHDGFGELLGREPEVGRDPWELVAAQARVDQRGRLVVAAEEERVEGTDPGQLAVVAGSREQPVHRVQDLVVAAAARAAGAGSGHRHAGQHQGLRQG